MSVYDVPPGQTFSPYHFEWTDVERRDSIS